MIRKVEMERFAVIKASIGNPNMAEFWRSMQGAGSPDELEAAIRPALGKTGLMLFVESLI